MSKEEIMQEIVDDIDKEIDQYVNLKYRINDVISCLEDSREGIRAMHELEKAKEKVKETLSEINSADHKLEVESVDLDDVDIGKTLQDLLKKMTGCEIGNIPFYDEEEYEDGEDNE
jgi:signal transduction histidine kinase